MKHINWLDSGDPQWGYEGPGWYFWDETGAYCHGPYISSALAWDKLVEYCEELDKVGADNE
jgi:hypothetical protein